MALRNLSNRKERSAGASLFLRVAQSSNVEEVLGNFAKVAVERGIHLYGVRVKRGRLEREFKPPNAGAVTGRINELAVSFEGGQTHLVVKFREPMDGALVCELECAAHLAARRIEFLAGGGAHPDRAVTRNVDRASVMDGLVGKSDLIQQVRQDIEGAAPAPARGDRFPALREGETLKEYICRAVLAAYEMERANVGSHSAAARRLGMKRTTLYDRLERARRYVTK
jgi:hypothetical protein